MKIVEQRLLRGPNIYSSGRVFLAVLDLEDLDDVPSTAVPGFVDRLLQMVPTLDEHRCSVGTRGGFVQRLREGTYMAHIVEHVLIELQCIAGTEVGFGKARMVRGRPRHYTVVCSYQLERVVERAAGVALALVEAIAHGQPFDLEPHLDELHDLVERHALGPSTRAIIEAAERRGLPYFRLSEDANLFQLGWGRHQKRIQATTTENTNYIAVSIASDKQLTKALLAEAGLPVPRGETVRSAEEAVQAAARLRRAVTVKPLDANQGKGVTTNLVEEAAIRIAFDRARGFGRNVIVEEFIEGDDYRVLVIDGEVVAAARRVPAGVVGDGVHDVRQLVERENAKPGRGNGHGNVLTRIRLDDAAVERLAQQGMTPETVPAPDQWVVLRGNANLSTGGTAEDVTESIHPETARACVRAARKIGLDVAGIDLMCVDIERQLSDQHGGIIEVNAAPGIRMHEHPSKGERHHVGEAIVNSLFPDGQDGRIPVVAITGTNGKTTTTLLTGHVLQHGSHCVGVATTEGVFIDGQPVARGDCTGYWSARMLLTSPEVGCAVLETARGGMLKRGLAFDRCDVGVVLNVQADHIGQDGINTLDDLARVKGLVAEAARRCLVLNAEDERCVAMARSRAEGCELIYFSLDERNEALRRHTERGGRAVTLHQSMIMLVHGEHRVPLVNVQRLPFTLYGHARHNIANALAAVAALTALGISGERIVAGLVSFTSSVASNPLRLNVFRSRSVNVLLDYAHNPAAYRAVIETGRNMAQRALIGVVAAPGDRRNEELQEMGAICGEGFDRLVIYEMDDRRGRAPGATAEELLRGARSAAPEREIEVVLDVRQAIRRGIETGSPGDTVIVGCASHIEDLQQVLAELGDGQEYTLHPSHPMLDTVERGAPAPRVAPPAAAGKPVDATA